MHFVVVSLSMEIRFFFVECQCLMFVCVLWFGSYLKANPWSENQKKNYMDFNLKEYKWIRIANERNKKKQAASTIESSWKCIWMYVFLDVCVRLDHRMVNIDLHTTTRKWEKQIQNLERIVWPCVCVYLCLCTCYQLVCLCMCRCWWFVCFFSSSVSHFHWLLSFTYAWIAHAHTRTPSVPKLNWEPNQTKPMPLKKEFTIYRLVNKNIWAALSNGYTHIFWTHIVRKRQSIMPPTFDKHFYVYINEIMRYPTINHVITNQ